MGEKLEDVGCVCRSTWTFYTGRTTAQKIYDLHLIRCKLCTTACISDELSAYRWIMAAPVVTVGRTAERAKLSQREGQRLNRESQRRTSEYSRFAMASRTQFLVSADLGQILMDLVLRSDLALDRLTSNREWRPAETRVART